MDPFRGGRMFQFVIQKGSSLLKTFKIHRISPSMKKNFSQEVLKWKKIYQVNPMRNLSEKFIKSQSDGFWKYSIMNPPLIQCLSRRFQTYHIFCQNIFAFEFFFCRKFFAPKFPSRCVPHFPLFVVLEKNVVRSVPHFLLLKFAYHICGTIVPHDKHCGL